MTPEHFRDLCGSFCQLSGLQAPALAQQDNGGMAFCVLARGHPATLVYAPLVSPSDAFIQFDMGEMPADAPLDHWKWLLRANDLTLGPPSPRLALNGADHVIVHAAYPLHQASAADLYQRLLALADAADEWREAMKA